MNPILKNVLAVIVGLIVGSIVNGFLISISPSIIPPPVGSDLTTAEGLQSAMLIMEPKHFLMPFLAHALGTFVGAFITYKISSSLRSALLVAAFFFLGGLYMVLILPNTPVWFIALDLIGAYFPMAWLAVKLLHK